MGRRIGAGKIKKYSLEFKLNMGLGAGNSCVFTLRGTL
jgi:hypothetical protein